MSLRDELKKKANLRLGPTAEQYGLCIFAREKPETGEYSRSNVTQGFAPATLLAIAAEIAIDYIRENPEVLTKEGE